MSSKPAVTPTTAPRRVGRPSMIHRDDIVRAVQAIGLENVTMRQVAEHLGVSVPGLYHHVRGRDDLLRLAAEGTLSQMSLPEDHGQTWPQWLREWGRYIRGAMSSEPELVRQYVVGSIATDRIIDSVGLMLDVLCERGFEPAAALEATEAISSLALGAAVDLIRERAAIDAGQPWTTRVRAGLKRHRPDELPTFRALIAAKHQPDADADFERHMTALLVGIAAQNRFPVTDVTEARPSN